MVQKAINDYITRYGVERFTPKAALFDMDGVLYDSMQNHAVAWHDSMKEYGIVMSREEAFLYEGMRGVETIQKMCIRQWGYKVSDDEAMKMYQTKSEHYSRCAPAFLIPHVHQLQEEMKRCGLTIGVVTGSGQVSLLKRILQDFDGLVSPDVLVSANDVQHGKPAPDPYLMGMKKAGTLPYETIVVENAPLGVQAARAAGCFTVAVNTGPLDDDTLWNAGANLVFHNMQEFISQLSCMVK